MKLLLPSVWVSEYIGRLFNASGMNITGRDDLLIILWQKTWYAIASRWSKPIAKRIISTFYITFLPISVWQHLHLTEINLWDSLEVTKEKRVFLTDFGNWKVNCSKFSFLLQKWQASCDDFGSGWSFTHKLHVILSFLYFLFFKYGPIEKSKNVPIGI